MRCFEHGATGDNPVYNLVSYAGETTLSKHIRDLDKFNVAQVGPIFKQLLQGLQQLAWSEPPLIHHDLKSDNVVVKMVDSKPQLTIIDFGAVEEYTNRRQPWLPASAATS